MDSDLLSKKDAREIGNLLMSFAADGALEFSRAAGYDLDVALLADALNAEVRAVVLGVIADAKHALDSGASEEVPLEIARHGMKVAGREAAKSLTPEQFWPE